MKIKFAILIIIALLSISYAGLREKEPTSIDEDLKIMWTVKTSQTMMSWSEALEYVENLNYHGYDDWRLPTEEELSSIIEERLISEDPHVTNVLLCKPFRKPSRGYLFSGTIVQGYKNAPYVMNIRNGHIFNGKGYKAYVRAVRDAEENDN